MGINSKRTSSPRELHIKLIPKAALNKVVADGENEAPIQSLKVYVTAVPEDGKANAAMIKLLAKYFHLPKSAFTLVRGHTSRSKVAHMQTKVEKTETRLVSSMRNTRRVRVRGS